MMNRRMDEWIAEIINQENYVLMNKSMDQWIDEYMNKLES